MRRAEQAGFSGSRKTGDSEVFQERCAKTRVHEREDRRGAVEIIRAAGRQRMRERPAGLRLRDGGPMTTDDADAHLGVVATDITTETKAVFPLMAPLYWPDPDGVNPADFVRASMSIPFFFEPVRVTRVPQGDKDRAAWARVVRNDRYPPPECAFVDGGVLSNFPIDLFHESDQTPTAPTFGVKLGADAQPVPHFDRLVQLTMGVFNAARHALDNDFISRNPDFRQLVCVVDTSVQNWLNFDLTPDDRVELFQRGRWRRSGSCAGSTGGSTSGCGPSWCRPTRVRPRRPRASSRPGRRAG